MEEQNRLYLFGYGSILWSPNFVYTQCWVAHLDGYKRRFLLGSTTARGCEESPGRAATLIPSPTDKVWGKVFEIVGEENVNITLEQLDAREYSYTRDTANVFFKDPLINTTNTNDNNKPFVPAIVYFANTQHKNFIGENENITKTADVIANSRGQIGHNVEYLFRLVDFMRENQLDGSADEYLFALNDLVRSSVGISSTLNSWQQISNDENFKHFC